MCGAWSAAKKVRKLIKMENSGSVEAQSGLDDERGRMDAIQDELDVMHDVGTDGKEH